MDKGRLSAGADLLRLGSLGIALALCVVLGLGLGLAARKLFDLGLWVVVAGLLLGVAAAFRLIVQEMRNLQRRGGGP